MTDEQTDYELLMAAHGFAVNFFGGDKHLAASWFVKYARKSKQADDFIKQEFTDDPPFCGILTTAKNRKFTRNRCKEESTNHRGPHWKNVDQVLCTCVFSCHYDTHVKTNFGEDDR